MADRDERELRRGLRAMVTDPPPGAPMAGVIEAARARRRGRRAGIGVVAVLVAVAAAVPIVLARDEEPPAAPPPPEYRFSLYVHCGVRYTSFLGRAWTTDPETTERYSAYGTGAFLGLPGTMTLVSADEVLYRSDDGKVIATFRPFPGPVPGCD